MEHVTIVGTEDNLLVLATESGARFALSIDDVLRAEIRRASAPRTPAAPALAASPREIQTHIRAGLSAAEVSELLGVRLEDVTRFEGPVLAEREHIVDQALAVPVLIGSEVEPDAQPTFGVAIRAKLADLVATGERWASWKEQSGWIIKLEFTANDVDHDARWSFDPRRSALAPLNQDATQLSRQGALPEGLIPRLRALDKDRPASPYKDDTRFDSGAFGPRLVAAPPAEPEAEERPAPRSAPSVQEAATNRAPAASATNAETADLLEALRRRRGQREAAPTIEETPVPSEGNSPIALFDGFGSAPSENDSEAVDDVEAPAEPTHRPVRPFEHKKPAPTAASAPAPSESEGSARRKRRTEMPSWDEIVFGARTDD